MSGVSRVFASQNEMPGTGSTALGAGTESQTQAIVYSVVNKLPMWFYGPQKLEKDHFNMGSTLAKHRGTPTLVLAPCDPRISPKSLTKMEGHHQLASASRSSFSSCSLLSPAQL